MQDRLPSASATTQNDGASASLTSVPPAARTASSRALALVVGHPHVEVPALLGVLRRQGGLAVAPRLLEPQPGHLAARVDGLAVLDLAAEEGGVERREPLGSARVEAGLELGEPGGVGTRRRASAANPLIRAGQVDVAAGDAADVVAGQRDDDLGVGQRDVGVVVGLLGGRADAVDQREAGREVTGAEAGADAG